jgi:hypothetical protein
MNTVNELSKGDILTSTNHGFDIEIMEIGKKNTRYINLETGEKVKGPTSMFNFMLREGVFVAKVEEVEEVKTVYHYSRIKFQSFDKDKSDGFWFTDIKPNDEDMLNEIGAAGASFCAVCEISFSNELSNSDDNDDVEQQLKDANADCIVNVFEEFTDYAMADKSKITILEWIEL